MRKGTVNCVVCGSEYEVCRLCPTTTSNTPWRVLCDTSVHYQVYLTIQDLKAKIITETEAKDCLNNIGISEDTVKTFLPHVQEILLPLFKNEQLKRKKKKETAFDTFKTDCQNVVSDNKEKESIFSVDSE